MSIEMALALVVLLGLSVWGILRWRPWVLVPPDRLLVTRAWPGGRIARRLGPGYHLLPRPFEVEAVELDLLPRRTTLLAERVRSRDGLSYKVRLDVLFAIDLVEVTLEDLPGLLAVLPADPAAPVHLHGEHLLRQLLARIDTPQLMRGLDVGRLGESLQERLRQRLQPLGLRLFRVLVQEVLPPADLQQALAERLIQPIDSGVRAASLQALRDSLAGWSAADQNVILSFLETAAMAGGTTDWNNPWVVERLLRNRRPGPPSHSPQS